MNKWHITKFQLSSFMCCFGLLITGSVLRMGIYRNALLQRFSPLLYLGLAGIFLYSKKRNQDLFQKKYDSLTLRCSLFLVFFSAVTLIMFGGVTDKISLFISIILPTIILAFRFRDSSELFQFMKQWMTWLKISVLLIVLMGIVDLATNYSITTFWAEYTSADSFYRMIKQRRIVSYMGHPLYTSEILLSYYVFSHLYCEMNKKKESPFAFFAALIGLLMTQSRVALVLLVIAYLLFNMKWGRIRYIIIALLGVLVLYNLHLLDSILERFIDVRFLTDIRNTSLIDLTQSGILKFYLFRGQDISVLSQAGSFAASLEYPILRWAYVFGSATSFFLSLLSFVIPLVYFLKAKQKEVLIAFIILALDVNSYSGFADSGMKATHYYIMCCLLLNVAQYFKIRYSRQIMGDKI